MMSMMGWILPGGAWLVPFALTGVQAFLVMEVALAVLLLMTVLMLWAKIRVSKVAERALLVAEKNLDDVSAQEAILRAVAQNANDGLVYQDMDARILWANPAYCRIMGRALEEIVGRRPQEFCFPPDMKSHDDDIANFRFDPDSYEFHTLVRRPNMRKNGELFWHEFNLSVVEPRDGEKRVILVSRDVSHQVKREDELEAARADLHHAAHHDALTGLHNRTAFLAATDAVLRRPNPRERAVGLLYIDLDHFKAFNDTHGHSAGDRILIDVAEAIRACAEPDDLSCRMGGMNSSWPVPASQNLIACNTWPTG